MIQTMVMGAEVDVADWEGGKTILVSHPSGQQFVIPLTAEQQELVHNKTSSLALPPDSIAQAG